MSDVLDLDPNVCLFIMGMIILFLVIYLIAKQSKVINYCPLRTIVEHQVIRVPVEDRVDLAFDDKHNVHNSTLKREATKVIEKLKLSDQHRYTQGSAFEEIKQLIDMSPDPDLDKLDQAFNSLDLIEHNHVYYHNGSIDEKELIRLLWERINHPINQCVLESLKNNIIEQLADCGDGHGSLHCCEGRVMRLIQTLEQCDQENLVDLRPMWAYREEISNKIIKYRQKLLNRVPPKYQQIVDKADPTDDDKKLLSQFNQCLISNLNKRFHLDYTSTELLTENELNDLTQVYYDSLYDF
jgi:hypothetical protein